MEGDKDKEMEKVSTTMTNLQCCLQCCSQRYQVYVTSIEQRKARILYHEKRARMIKWMLDVETSEIARNHACLARTKERLEFLCSERATDEQVEEKIDKHVEETMDSKGKHTIF